MSRRRRKPYDPAAAERARIERELAQAAANADPTSWGPNADTLAQRDVSDAEETRQKVRRIIRMDVFDLLAQRDATLPIAYVRRYQADVATYLRSAGVAPVAPVVDFSAPEREFAAIAAGQRLRRVEEYLGVTARSILRTISESALGTTGRSWRDVVRRVTGEKDEGGQAALVRSAMRELAGAYAVVDGQRLAG